MTYELETEAQAAREADRSIPFVEAHHHLWDLQRLRYDWLDGPGLPGHTAQLGDYRMIRSDWGMERLMKEFYGSNVVKSVHVEAACSDPDPIAETIWLNSVAEQYGFPHALVVYCDIESGDGETQLMRHVAASPRVRGVRTRMRASNSHTTEFGAYAVLAKLGLSYEISAPEGGLMAGRDVAAAYPDLQCIVGHAGDPRERSASYVERWRREISALAEVPNIACKISGFGMWDHDWTIESVRPYVMHCIDRFGVDRCMFGTNWPVDVLYSSYLRQVDAWRLIIARDGFSRTDQEKMLHGNAEKFYRL